MEACSKKSSETYDTTGTAVSRGIWIKPSTHFNPFRTRKKIRQTNAKSCFPKNANAERVCETLLITLVVHELDMKIYYTVNTIETVERRNSGPTKPNASSAKNRVTNWFSYDTIFICCILFFRVLVALGLYDVRRVSTPL